MDENLGLRGRVLIVDDLSSNVLLLTLILQKAGYQHLRSTTEPKEVLAIFIEFKPDLLVLDLHMPGMDGFDVMEQLKGAVSKETFFPILILTGDSSTEMKQRALASGAKDFLTKSFDVPEVLQRIKNLLETRFLHLQLQDQNRILEIKVKERTRELEEARLEILEKLSLAAEFRDDETGQHTQRVGRLSAILARELGLADEAVELIRLAAPLHDIGKIGITDSLLLKRGGLSADEFSDIKNHAHIGSQILAGSRSPLLQLAEQIALTHHECWDGSGYPVGSSGEEIPIAARIVSVVDVFDALTHERPYKKAWSENDAAAEIERLSGSKFDPNIVFKFLLLLRDGRLK